MQINKRKIRLIILIVLGALILILLFVKKENFEEKIKDLNRGNYAEEK